MMSGIVSSVLVLCAYLVAVLLFPGRAEATELESIYVRVPISPEAYRRWLASPLRHAGDFDDWRGMSDQWEDDWAEEFYDWDFATNGDLVASIRDQMTSEWNDEWNSQPYVDYDEAVGVFRYAQLLYDENFINFANDLAAYRSFADFKDTDEPGFIVIYPFLWDPGYGVIMEIGRGGAAFHAENAPPAGFKAFIDEANAHFDAELDALEED